MRAGLLGLDLFDWIRREQQMTIPVVLWSFFGELRLRKDGPPTFRLPKGHVFVRLPAGIRQIQLAFESVIADDARLSVQDLKSNLDELYGCDASLQNPFERMPAEQFARVAASVTTLRDGLRSIFDLLLEACGRLGRNDGSALKSLLGLPDWQQVRKEARDLDRHLRLVSIQVVEIAILNTAAIGVDSFVEWNKRNAPNTSGGLMAARFYRDRLLTMENLLQRLGKWIQEIKPPTAT